MTSVACAVGGKSLKRAAFFQNQRAGIAKHRSFKISLNMCVFRLVFRVHSSVTGISICTLFRSYSSCELYGHVFRKLFVRRTVVLTIIICTHNPISRSFSTPLRPCLSPYNLVSRYQNLISYCVFSIQPLTRFNPYPNLTNDASTVIKNHIHGKEVDQQMTVIGVLILLTDSMVIPLMQHGPTISHLLQINKLARPCYLQVNFNNSETIIGDE